MKRRFWVSTLFVICSSFLQAQFVNNHWVVGLNPLLFNIKKDTTSNILYTTNNIYYEHGQSNINDSNGLLFSCNGFSIIDKNGNFMENGEYILPDKLANYVGTSPLYQQTIILPKADSQFYVFAWGISNNLFDSIQNGFSVWRYDILTYSIVDLKENNGIGKVISKLNYLLEHDTLSACQMSAVRHANGRDWWLVKPHAYRHKFYTFLVTSDSIRQMPIQEFETPIFTNGVDGQSNFSPDGSLYVMCSTFSTEYTQVNHFDRCTGKMNKFKSIKRLYDSIYNGYIVINGACFSSNNQFVYLFNNLHIVQYDLLTDERIELPIDSLLAPKGIILAYNSNDGRIYIGNWVKQFGAMSYVEFPNKKGVGANYCRMCYKTKNNNTASPPNMPNYELGALKGSPCDTIKPPYIPVTEIKIFPNPVSEKLTLEFPLGIHNAEVAIFNMLGQRVHLSSHTEILNNKIELSVRHLARALYSIKIVTDGEQFVGKFVRE